MSVPVTVCMRCWRPVLLDARSHWRDVRSGGDEPLRLFLCDHCTRAIPGAAARDAFLERAALLAPFETSTPTGTGVRVVIWEAPRAGLRAHG